MRDALISTIVLNWNRAPLLETTLESYIATVTPPFELMIVDNASTDSSRDVIERFVARYPATRVMPLDENRGGEAVNAVLDDVAGDLVHIAENDIEYRPGWSERVRAVFDAFPDLGQFSPFGVTPTDDEAWENKPASLRYKGEIIVYQAHRNLGTTCFLRRAVVDRGVRLRNWPTSEAGFKLPNDPQLSSDVKALGYWCAYNDHYLVRNIGHEMAEYGRDPGYYEENYRAKHGLEIWERRKAAAESMPKPHRASHLFPDRPLSPEKTEAMVGDRPARLWSMFDGWTAELEVVEFMYALVRMLKPRSVLETGTWHGLTACAVGRALRDNGFGKLVSLEIDPANCAVAEDNMRRHGVADQVSIVCGNSLDYRAEDGLDLCLFDSELSRRGEEFLYFLPRMVPGATVVFHDTNDAHRVVGQVIQWLMKRRLLVGMFLPTPRGLFLGQAVQPPPKHS